MTLKPENLGQEIDEYLESVGAGPDGPLADDITLLGAVVANQVDSIQFPDEQQTGSTTYKYRSPYYNLGDGIKKLTRPSGKL